jgi:hypothetical protein
MHLRRTYSQIKTQREKTRVILSGNKTKGIMRKVALMFRVSRSYMLINKANHIMARAAIKTRK